VSESDLTNGWYPAPHHQPPTHSQQAARPAASSHSATASPCCHRRRVVVVVVVVLCCCVVVVASLVCSFVGRSVGRCLSSSSSPSAVLTTPTNVGRKATNVLKVKNVWVCWCCDLMWCGVVFLVLRKWQRYLWSLDWYCFYLACLVWLLRLMG